MTRAHVVVEPDLASAATAAAGGGDADGKHCVLCCSSLSPRIDTAFSCCCWNNCTVPPSCYSVHRMCSSSGRLPQRLLVSSVPGRTTLADSSRASCPSHETSRYSPPCSCNWFSHVQWQLDDGIGRQDQRLPVTEGHHAKPSARQ